VDVRLPDGTIVQNVPDGTSRAQLAEKLRRNGYDVPDEWLSEPKGGVLAAAQKGIESLISSGRTAFGAATGDATEAGRAGAARSQDIAGRYKDETGWDKVTEKFNDPNGGFMSAAGEVLRQTPLYLAEQAPNLATTLGAAKLGAMAGAPLGGPVGSAIGAGVGALGASFIPQLGSNVERQAQEKGQVDMGSAVAGAGVQAGLDAAATAFIMGKTLVGKVLGPQVEALMARGSTQAAEQLAKQGLARTMASGAGRGMLAEVPTEVVQQMIERAQAGLPLTTPDALKEYGETAYAAAQVGVPLGGAGRVVDRGAARDKQQALLDEQQKQAYLQQQQEEQRKLQDPNYWSALEGKYLQAQQQFNQLVSSIPKSDGTALTAQIIQQKKAEAGAFKRDQLDPLAHEFSKVAPQLRAQRQPIYDFAAELTKQQEQQRQQQEAAARAQDQDAFLEFQMGPDAMRRVQQRAPQDSSQLEWMQGLGQPPEQPSPFQGVGDAATQAGEQGVRDALTPEEFALQGMEKNPKAMQARESSRVRAAVEQLLQNRNLAYQYVETKGSIPGLTPRENQQARSIVAEQLRQSDQQQLRELPPAQTQQTDEGALLDQQNQMAQEFEAEDRWGRVFGEDGQIQEAPPIQRTAQELTGQRMQDPLNDAAITAADGEQLPTRRIYGQGEAQVGKSYNAKEAEEELKALLRKRESLRATEPNIKSPAGRSQSEEYKQLTEQVREMVELVRDARASITGRVYRKAPADYGFDYQEDIGQPQGRLITRDAEVEQRPAPKLQRAPGPGRQEEQQALETGVNKEKFKATVRYAREPQEQEQPGPQSVRAKYVAALDDSRVDNKTKQTLLDAQHLLRDPQSQDILSAYLDRVLAGEFSTIEKQTARRVEAPVGVEGEVRTAAAKVVEKKRVPLDPGTLQGKQQELAPLRDAIEGEEQRSREEDVRKLRSTLVTADRQAKVSAFTQQLKEANDKLPHMQTRVNALQARLEKLSKDGPKVEGIDNPVAARVREQGFKEAYAAIEKITSMIPDRMQRAGEVQRARQQHEQTKRALAESTNDVELQRAADAAQAAFERLYDSERQFKALEKQLEELDTFIKIRRGDVAVRGAGYKKVTPDNTKETEETRQQLTKEGPALSEMQRRRQEAEKGLKAVKAEAQREAEAKQREQEADELNAPLDEKKAEADAKLKAKQVGEVTRVEGVSEAAREARDDDGWMDPQPEKNPIKQKARLVRELKQLEAKIAGETARVKPKYNREEVLERRIERLERVYTGLKSSEKRAELAPLIDRVRAELRNAKGKNTSTVVAYPGIKADRLRAAELEEKIAALELKADAWRARMKELFSAPRPRIKEAGDAKKRAILKHAADKAASKEAADEAASRVGAPEIDSKEKTKSEIDKARKVKKTLYQGNLGPSGKPILEAEQDALDKRKAARTSGEAAQTREENKEADQRVRNELDAMFPDAKTYPHNKIEVYGDFPAFLKAAKERIPEEILKTIKPIDGAFTYGGVVFLIARNLKPGQVAAKVLHEVGAHIGFRNMFNDSQLKGLSAVVESWIKRNDSSVEAQIGKAVKARLKEAGIGKDHKDYMDEVLGYGVEEAVNAGVKGSSPQVKGWLDRMKRRFQEALDKFFGRPTKLTAQNLVDMAYGAAHRELSTTLGKFEGAAGTSDSLLFSRGTPTYAAGWEDAQALGKKLVARDKGLVDKAKQNLFGLAFRTQFVDSAAPMEKIANEQMDAVKGTQTMFYIRWYGQRGNFLSQAAVSGPPVLKELTRERDGRKEWVIEATNNGGLAKVSKILMRGTKAAGSADAVNELFTQYTVAQRAKRLGLKALDTSLTITQADIDAAMANIDAKGLTPIFKEAYDQYSDFNKGMLEFAVATGALSKKTFNDLTKTGDYVPYYREMNGNYELIIGNETPVKIGNMKDAPHLKELLGGDQKVMDFMSSSVLNASMLLDMALRNLATKNAVYELRDIGGAKIVGSRHAAPNVVHFFDKGEERAALIDTDKFGVPADLLVKGLAGIPTMLPAAVRAMGIPAQLLRKAVTLSPLYVARQLFRDSTASILVTGANTVPVISALKQWNNTDSELTRRGVTGGQIVTGNAPEDIALVMRQIASGKGSINTALAKLEAWAMNADASSRRAQFKSMREQGLSEMEATLAALESMNFNKRGVSPSVHVLSTLIPFFNAQIQGLDVMYKAFRGKMPFNERLRVREKMFTRGLMIAASSMAYAALMQDDEAYKNASPSERYSNWFVRIPGLDEPVRVPIPFELGYVFKAIPEAVFNTMMTDKNKELHAEQAKEAALFIAKQMIPGGSSYGIPQAVKPMLEVMMNKSLYNDAPIESVSEGQLLPEFRYRDNTSDLAKEIGEHAGVSPLKVEHLIRGYTASMGLALVQALSFSSGPEKAARRTSDMPVFGPLFQPNDAQGIINNVYQRVQHLEQVKKTFDDMVAKGDGAAARAFIQENMTELVQADAAGDFKKIMGELSAMEKAVKADPKMPADEKRRLLDMLRQRKIETAKTVRAFLDKT
jgi:hypothetical protein